MTSILQKPTALIGYGIQTLNRGPYSVLALVARAATFSVFFRSGLVKISDWNAALQLFANEYKVPVLPPEVAAYMSASMELGLSSLVLIGFATRLSTLGLLGMVLTIQIFVYPEAWPDHLQWLAFMLFIVCRGPGIFSVDHLIARAMGVKSAAA